MFSSLTSIGLASTFSMPASISNMTTEPVMEQSAGASGMIADLLPSTLLESFLPGFGYVRRIILVSIGFDIQLLVTAVIAVGLALSGGQFVYAKLLELWYTWFTASVSITSRERIYRDIMRWMAAHVVNDDTQRLTVSKTTRFVFDDDEEDDNGLPTIQYSPSFGELAFWFEGRRFVFSREDNEKQTMAWPYNQSETIRFNVSGRSAAPVKRLIAECQRWTKEQERNKTNIVCPDSSSAEWSQGINRTSRPINTVYMDERIRNKLLRDAKKFVLPETARFYASRGIPYRRGYLFWGPPGTGKSSLSFALAGVLGYTIYYLSLNDSNLSDAKLRTLFNDLPSRSILLMEDIDAVGLARKNLKSSSSSSSKRDATPPAPPGKDKKDGKDGTADKVTLSGLLNAIDGVASAEGRILIMTTNDPEALDPALIRPGRVDLQVLFGHATRTHAEEMYARFFPEESEDEDETSPLMEKKLTRPLREMASDFADILPEGILTPAEVQGFLLVRSEDPQKALDEFPNWVEQMKVTKASGKNIIEHEELVPVDNKDKKEEDKKKENADAEKEGQGVTTENKETKKTEEDIKKEDDTSATETQSAVIESEADTEDDDDEK